MLDDMTVLAAAAHSYRAAATAAGVTWPQPAGTPDGQPPELVYRLFDVEHVPDQLIWLQSQGWDSGMLFPDGGDLLPWPTRETAGESLNLLCYSVGTPFNWRQQIPIFRFNIFVYTFVLAAGYEGEIWRYMIDVDTWDPARASPSLATLFTEWTRGINAGVVRYEPAIRRLFVGDRSSATPQLEVLQQRAPDLDPLAFPIDLSFEPLLLARQRECGVDLAVIDRGLDSQAELQDAVDAVRGSLGL